MNHTSDLWLRAWPKRRAGTRPSPPPAGAGARHLLRKAAAVAALLAAPALPAVAQDQATIDRTQIIGNRELPKVLYIVPWKKPVPGDLSGKPLSSVVDEALAPIDRDVFRRQVRYDAQAAPKPDTPAGAAPAAR